MAIDIGRIAYQAYCKKLEDDECDCDLSKWEDLGKISQDAWRHAAVAVSQYLDEEREKYEAQKDEDNAAFPNY